MDNSKCVRCDGDVIIHKKDTTTVVKGTELTYLKESSECVDCGFEYVTQQQLDANNYRMNDAFIKRNWDKLWGR